MVETMLFDAVEKKGRTVLKTAAQVIAALRERYKDTTAYAFFTEVGNATGSRCNRHADALVMSLWPSRGLEITGFEVKVSRSDWKHELEQPEKANAVAQYCDRWYLVVGDENIVQNGELPLTWGLMAPDKNGALRVRVEAKPNEFLKPLDRLFVASILRSTQAQVSDYATLSKVKEEARKEERKFAKESAENSVRYQLEELEELKKTVEKFEKASGIHINRWQGGEKIGEAVRMVMNGMAGKQLDQLRYLRSSAERIMREIDTELQVHVNLKAEESTQSGM